VFQCAAINNLKQFVADADAAILLAYASFPPYYFFAFSLALWMNAFSQEF
jgi:hypothetical protein